MDNVLDIADFLDMGYGLEEIQDDMDSEELSEVNESIGESLFESYEQ